MDFIVFASAEKMNSIDEENNSNRKKNTEQNKINNIKKEQNRFIPK